MKLEVIQAIDTFALISERNRITFQLSVHHVMIRTWPPGPELHVCVGA